MTDAYSPFDGEYRQTGSLAPENTNAEQVDQPEQAQSLSGDAVDHAASVLGLEVSRKVESLFGPYGTQDVVDRMEEMRETGTIDMSAYAGEPDHDDNTAMYDWKASPLTGPTELD